MPFNTALTTTQKNAIRSGAYGAKQYIALCPNTIVFQALTAEAITAAPFSEITFDTVSTGAYSDIKAGMTVFISQGTNLLYPLWRGCIRKSATSGTVHFTQKVTAAVQTGYYITVVDDYDLHKKEYTFSSTGVQSKNIDETFTTPKPTFYGLQASYVGIGSSASFDFAPVGVANYPGATILSYSWDVDDGTITTGSTSTQNITASFPTGHRWVRLTITDSQSVSNYFVFEVHIVPADFSSGVWLTNSGVSVSSDVGDGQPGTAGSGYNADLTGYGDVGSVLDQTRMTVFSVDFYGSGDAGLPNVEFVGRLVQESPTLVADTKYGRLASHGWSAEGIIGQLNRLHNPNFTAINNTSPTAFDDIKTITPPRLIAYIATWHSTLSNICSIQVDDSDNNFIYDADTNVTSQNALDAFAEIADWINASVETSPQGEMRITRKTAYRTDRSSIPLILDVTYDDMQSWGFQSSYYDDTGLVEIGAFEFNTTAGTVDIFTALSPGNQRGNHSHVSQYPNQLLTANQSEAASKTEVGGRAANHYAFNNDTRTLEVTFHGGFRFLQASWYDRYTFDVIAASDNTRGVILSASDYFQCVAVQQSYDPERNGRTVSATFKPETEGSDYMLFPDIVPEATERGLPILSTRPVDENFYFDPYSNYDSLTPDDLDLQPLDPKSSLGGSSPTGYDTSGDAGSGQPEIGCWKDKIWFNSAAGVSTPFDTTDAAIYTVKATGSARVSDGGDTINHIYSDDLESGGGALTHEVSAAYPFGNRSPTIGGSIQAGVGEGGSYGVRGGTVSTFSNAQVVVDLGAESTITAVSLRYRSTGATLASSIFYYYDENRNFLGASGQTSHPPSSSWATRSASVNVAGVRYIGFIHETNKGDEGAIAYLDNISVDYQEQGAEAYHMDAFYYWQQGTTPALHTSGNGLQVNGVNAANEALNVPDYSEDHSYTFAITGDTNPISFGFSDFTGHSDNEAKTLNLEVCGDGATQT